LEYCRATGTHSGGKFEIGFPKIKDETGFAWSRYIALDYKADSETHLFGLSEAALARGFPTLRRSQKQSAESFARHIDFFVAFYYDVFVLVGKPAR
jgi:hypothetical protein